MEEQDVIRNFSESIRQLRKSNGMTLEAFSSCTGVSRNTVVNYENGHSMPNLYTVMLIASKLGVSIDQLVGIDRHAN